MGDTVLESAFVTGCCAVANSGVAFAEEVLQEFEHVAVDAEFFQFVKKQWT